MGAPGPGGANHAGAPDGKPPEPPKHPHRRRATGPTGIQPVGDALCHTNPTFAYGASLSLDHGFTLARIATETTDPGSLAVAFDEAVGADAAARFDAVSAEDRDRLRLWQGEPIDVRDPGDSMALFLRMTAYPAAARDPDLFRAVARRVNLLDPPDALARDEELIARARELAPGVGATAPAGPTRQDVLDAIAQVRGSALYSALASRLLGEHPRQ
jgi:hypothetical protein